jgi:5'-3' exonuclease
MKSLKDLLNLLINDLDKITKTFSYDNIYFCSDSKGGNWRKSIYKDYKGNRKKDESIDWDFVYKTFDDFKEVIKKRRNIKFLEMAQRFTQKTIH